MDDVGSSKSSSDEEIGISMSASCVKRIPSGQISPLNDTRAIEVLIFVSGKTILISVHSERRCKARTLARMH